MSRIHLRRALILAIAALVPALAHAQRIERPKLKSDADTNDWVAYYRHGVTLLKEFPERAADAFYWSARLNPAAAEPQYARGVALWRSRPAQFAEYLTGSASAAKSYAWIDSLLFGALQRNPLLDQRLTLWMYEALPGEWSRDYWTRGKMAYGAGKYEEALRWYGKMLDNPNDKRAGAHYDRALAYVALKQYDSALADLDRLLERMRRQDVKRLVSVYESKAMYEYAQGSIHVAKKDYPRAREAFGRALVEDLSLYTVHLALGDVARLQGDTAAALQEYEQAVELGPRDANLRFVYGTVLVQTGQHEKAVEQFRRATELEPYWSVPYMNLAFALEKSGDAAGATTAYEEFLRRAPRAGLEAQVEYARRRLNR